MARPPTYGERVNLQVRLPVSLHERLKDTANEREIAMNLIIIKALERYLDNLVSLP